MTFSYSHSVDVDASSENSTSVRLYIFIKFFIHNSKNQYSNTGHMKKCVRNLLLTSYPSKNHRFHQLHSCLWLLHNVIIRTSTTSFKPGSPGHHFTTSVSFLVSSHTFHCDEIIFYGFRLWQSVVSSTSGRYADMTHPFRGPGTVKQAETNCSRRQNTSY